LSLTALSSRNGRAIKLQHFNVSHGSTARFLRDGKKYYFNCAANLLLFLTVKEFSKSVNSRWSYCKKFDTTFFWDTV